MVVDGPTMYWTESSNQLPTATSGSVRSCALQGCDNSPQTIASGLSLPGGVAVDEHNVYWAEFGEADWSGLIRSARK